jgi:hypothetical protein
MGGGLEDMPEVCPATTTDATGEKQMKTLHLDALTASVSAVDLEAHGSTLAMLGQSLHEELERHGANPATGTRNLISTMGNRQDAIPTGLTYHNVQPLRPHVVRAEDRPINERFLRGKPLLCGDLASVPDGIRLETALLRISLHVHAAIDHEAGSATFYVQRDGPPETMMAAAAGRRLGEIVEIGHCADLAVRHMRIAEGDEMTRVIGSPWTDGVAVVTDLPGWTTVGYEPVVTDPRARWGGPRAA